MSTITEPLFTPGEFAHLLDDIYGTTTSEETEHGHHI